MARTKTTELPPVAFQPLTSDNWPLFESLFGERGACGGCWCMYHRAMKADYEKNKFGGNKRMLRNLVKKGEMVGLLAVSGEEAIAWMSLAPREQYKRLENSRIHRRIDDSQVWSITCFFIRKGFRNKGMSTALIEKAKEFAGENKIRILEAYPVKPYAGKMPDAFAWTGLYSTFARAGFKIVSDASKARPMMRFVIP